MTGFTPAGTPRVSDDPVLGCTRLAPSDSSDGVVVLAADTVEDTTSVGLECTTGLDVDGNWAGGNSVHGISNTRYSSDAGSDCKTSSASTVSSSVSVGRAGV